MTWSGGNATIATDLIAELGANVPEFQQLTQEKLKKLIQFGSVKNPLDLPWKNISDEYIKIAKIAIKDPNIGAVFVESYRPHGNEEILENYFKNLLDLKNYCKQLRKLLFLSLPFTDYQKREKFKRMVIEMEIPLFPSFERTAKAFINLYKYQEKENKMND